MNSNLQKTANDIRISIIQELLAANSGHTAGPLGAADIFTALYFGGVLNYKSGEPHWPDRDRLVVSAGHYSPLVYATLAMAGYFPESELSTFRKINSRLQGHVYNGTTPGVEASGGPLGQGYSQAVGIALAAKMDKAKHRIYCFSSDGEHEEGQTWEAILFAGDRKLDNLTVLLDKNNIQIDGPNYQIMPIDPIAEKYIAFHWHTQFIDGHDIGAIVRACIATQQVKDKPSVIICQTTPGKGVSFMENNFHWHGKPPSPEEGKKALNELQGRNDR